MRRVETSGRELIFGGTPVSASASSARTRLRRRFHRHGGRTTRGVLRLRIASSLATPDSPVAADVSRLAHPATNHLLQIEVANTGIWEFATVPSDSTGLGLENLRRRLRRYYPDAHEFSIGQEGGWVVAKLAISNCQLPIEQPRTSA